MIPLGIDISQLTFDAGVELNSKFKHKQFANTAAGFKLLQTWLVSLFGSEQRFHVCMEATGAYWEALAEFLHSAQHKVSVVNPARIKGYAKSKLVRHKTDKIDCALNRSYCATENPSAWHPPAPEIKALRGLVRRRHDLTQMQTQETNRLKSGSATTQVAASIQSCLDYFKASIKDIDQQITALLAQHPQIAHQVELLCSIQGIGKHTAVRMLAEALDITQYADARAFAASIGVTPAWHTSGTSVRSQPHISKVGNAHLRAALWWPTIAAMRHNPVIRDFAAKLRQQNKKNGLIIIACMHKLIRLAFGVIHNDTPFDPLWHMRQA